MAVGDFKHYDPDADIYNLLQLPVSASVDDIKAAFRKQMKSSHTDVGASGKAAEIFARLTAAKKSIESDRATYDAERAAYQRGAYAPPPQAGGGQSRGNPDEMFGGVDHLMASFRANNAGGGFQHARAQTFGREGSATLGGGHPGETIAEMAARMGVSQGDNISVGRGGHSGSLFTGTVFTNPPPHGAAAYRVAAEPMPQRDQFDLGEIFADLFGGGDSKAPKQSGEGILDFLIK